MHEGSEFDDIYCVFGDIYQYHKAGCLSSLAGFGFNAIREHLCLMCVQ